MSTGTRYQNLAILGFGKMGRAIAGSLRGWNLLVHDVAAGALQDLPESCKIASPEEISASGYPVLLAVKPAQITEAAALIPDERLIISIAAGISLSAIESSRARRGAVVRAMPNIPLRVGAGITAICANNRAGEDGLQFAESIFGSLGSVVRLPDESQMHAVTGLSGSGPAFVYLMMAAMEDAGVAEGLPRPLSRKLAADTVYGAAMVARSNPDISLSDLIAEVTSPGGTTIAGILSLKEDAAEGAMAAAVRAAAERSRELSGGH